VDEAFERLVDRFAGDPDVTVGTGFGASRGLRVNDRIFAIFHGTELVLKLPRARVDELVEAGAGQRFDPGHGRIMREWIALSATEVDRWPGLASDAIAYVRTGARSRR
jgi:hypothetical protein